MAAWVVWLIIAGILFVSEMLTLTFYLLWLGIAAVAGAVAALAAPDSLSIQVVAASLVALILTLYSKRISKRVRTGQGYRDAVDTLVGKEALVMRDITKEANGIVKVSGDTWSATADEYIAKGEMVRIIQRSNTIVHVKRERELK